MGGHPGAGGRCEPRLRASERPVKAFISSVMTPDVAWARTTTVQVLDEVPFLVAWAFEFTPASSEEVDQSYLRHVREADFVVWLVGGTTTQPVVSEITEALTHNGRLIVLLLPAEERDSATELLIARVRPHAKYRELATATPEELRLELRTALGDEVVRALRGQPELGRLALIEEAGRASRARCIARWLAAGADAALAHELADEVSVGAPPAEATPSADRRVVVLSAEVGAGKSLAGERLHQRAIAACLADAAAPIPVWLRGRDIGGRMLREVVAESCAGLGEPRHQGLTLVIDGADEPGPATAFDLLTAARELAETWPNTGIVLTTRPIPSFGQAVEIVRVPPLEEMESLALTTRV